MDQVDICIAGAGITGLAIARQLARARQQLSIVLVDQETAIGQHTSSRNSEVIHAGIYYPANSLKAGLCVRGKHLLYEYCAEHGVPFKRLGKLIVAAQQEDEERLAALQNQARDNGVPDLEMIGRRRLTRLEPAVTGSAALLSPSTGIIDSHAFMHSLLADAEQGGVMLARQTRIENVSRDGSGFLVQTRNTGTEGGGYALRCQAFINCAGLQAQQIASFLNNGRPDAIPRLFYCKGDYFSYAGRNPFRHLIYPLPEAHTSGLGIHATIDMGGQLRFGPDTDYIEHIDYKVDPGKAVKFARAIRDYFPAIEASQLYPAYAGVRPKLAGPGEPPADFVIASDFRPGGDKAAGKKATGNRTANLVQLFGIESPGLTASLALAEEVGLRLGL